MGSPTFVRIRGLSRKGKNRVIERGDIWQVVKCWESVPCLNNRPGILLEAPGGYLRWMSLRDDPDFLIVSKTGAAPD